MPLTGTSAALATALALAGGVTDPTGVTKIGSLATALNSWLVSNSVVTNIPPDGTLTAAGAAVTGQGRVDFTNNGDHFGLALAASIPASDPAGLEKWKKLGNAFHAHIKANGRVNPTGFVANPLGGSVTGLGTLTFTSSVFSPTLAAELSLIDSANQGVWLALGSALLTYLTSNTQIGVGAATGFTSPPGGGLLVGVSVFV